MAEDSEGPSLTHELRDAAPYGAGAYVAGLAITFAIVSLSDVFQGSLGMAGLVYGIFHLVVEFESGGGSMVDQNEPLLFMFLAIPALPTIVAARAYATEAVAAAAGDGGSDDAPGPVSDAARRGALVAGGYALAMVLGALFFSATVQTGGLVETRTATGRLDVVTALLGGLVVSGAFGAVGGVLADRESDWPFYFVVGGLGLLVLLIVLSAGSA